MKKKALGLLAATGALFAMNAHAVIDTTAATTGITDAQAAILVVVTAFVTLSTTLLGVVMVGNFIKKRSGA